MDNNTLVSILVANYNNGIYIVEALNSVVQQTYKHIEIVIVDDDSDDDSVYIIESYIESHPDNKFVFIRNQDHSGCGKIKRQLIEMSNGEYFAFLDPDDTLSFDAVEKLLDVHKKNSTFSIVYSTHYLCDADLNVVSVATWPGEIPSGMSNLNSNGGHISAFALCKRQCYNKTGGIDPKFVVAEDQDLYFKMEEIAPVFFTKNALYYYRKHDHNMSYSSQKELLNAYWLYVCRRDAYHRRRRNGIKIPNISLRALAICKMNYKFEFIKAKKNNDEIWIWEVMKLLPYIPLSIRKSIRRLKEVFI